MKNRPKPNYKRNLDFNEEYEDRISKRQKRIGKEKIITPEIIEESEFEDEQQEISQELETNEDNLGFNFNEEEIIKLNRKKQSRRELEVVLEEISEEELKDLEFEEEYKEELTGKITELYVELCKQEGILFKGKRKMMEIYYEFGKKFEEKINTLLDDELDEEATVVNKIIEEIVKNGISHNRRSIVRRSVKARKIYKIISVEGGKEKIRKLKNLNSEDYMKFNFKEIGEWKKDR